MPGVLDTAGSISSALSVFEYTVNTNAYSCIFSSVTLRTYDFCLVWYSCNRQRETFLRFCIRLYQRDLSEIVSAVKFGTNKATVQQPVTIIVTVRIHTSNVIACRRIRAHRHTKLQMRAVLCTLEMGKYTRTQHKGGT